jgi:hypothetical protein
MCNPVSQNTETICKYIFGKEAEEVFTNVKIKNIGNKRKFIDQCLGVCTRINNYILTHKEGLFVIDPRAFNNQCHLYSLRAVQAMKLEGGDETRFRLLSFFLSMPLTGNLALFKEAVNGSLLGMGEGYDEHNSTEKNFYAAFKDHSIPFNKKNVEEFLKVDSSGRLKEVRLRLNQVFEDHLKESLSSLKDSSPLHLELYKLAHIPEEQLRIKSPTLGSKECYYTFPKLAGVAFMLDVLAREKIGFAIKVKVITKDGYAGRVSQCSAPFEDNEPVIVFEAIATDGTLSLAQCREEAKKCPSYFQNHPTKTKEHDTCFFCEKTEQDLTPFIDRLQEVMKSPQEMFYALGADFIVNHQKEFHHFFESEDYPNLSQIFQEAVPNIEKLGLSSDKPLTFSICHAHPDLGKHAKTASMELDTAPEQFLKTRGLT